MRASGILMPVFSLPGPFGIGTLGSEAAAFVDFLAEAKQTFGRSCPSALPAMATVPTRAFPPLPETPTLSISVCWRQMAI